MKLRKLIEGLKIERLRGDLRLEIEGLSPDSRRVKRDFLFVAIEGFKKDGHQYIREALRRGAKAIVLEKEVKVPHPEVALIKVSSSRLALAQLSNNFYGFPSGRIRVIGITGTNGKTTTTHLVESIFKKAGFRVGRISTLDYDLGDGPHPSSLTTPESQDLQRMLRAMVDQNLDYVAMEVSSHSLALHRVEGVEFDWAVFTNLSPEHLDFHRTMDEYREAKVYLFRNLGKEAKKKVLKKAAINLDDPVGSYIIDNTGSEIVTYGIEKKAVVKGRLLQMGLEGTSFFLEAREIGQRRVNLSLLGIHNVYNALAASSVALGEGIDFTSIKQGLEEVRKIPGRLESIENESGFKVFVDYAHTEEGLKKVLQALRKMTRGRLWVVFGCGGDRDPQKRPLMGKVALKMSDYFIVTSDNSRSEDPEEIISQIEKGIREEGGREGTNYLKLVDRRQAIRMALKRVRKGDILLVAGKGHERVQIFKDRVIEFDDREVVRELLDDLGK